MAASCPGTARGGPVEAYRKLLMRDDAAAMREGARLGVESGAPKSSLRVRAIDEAKKFLVMAVYLWVLFGLFSLHRTIVLQQADIDLQDEGFALVNALVLAKVMLVADNLRLGTRFMGVRADWPVICSVLYSSLVFALVLIGFHIAEHAAMALLRGRPLADSLSDFGGRMKGVLCAAGIAFVALVPFFAFREIDSVLAGGRLWRLLFTRYKAIPVHRGGAEAAT